MFPSSRSAIAPFVVMDVMEAAAKLERAGRQVFHMEVGQPSTPAPGVVIQAARRALSGDKLGYTVAMGIPELRRRIAEHYRIRHHVEVPVERIVVTTGSSGAFLLAFLACFEEGARVAMAAPSYPCYRNILQSLDIEPVVIPCGPETRYQVTPELLDQAGRIDGVIVASPSNPTGSIIEPEAMAALSAYCQAAGVRLISDEIYHGIQYDLAPVTAARFGEQNILVNSFSKYFSMTGWRIGWMVAPIELVRPVEKLMQNYFISAPSLSQLAAVAAFDGTEELEGHVERYRRNRGLVLDALPGLGVNSVAPPDGAFYVYADVPHLTSDSVRFCAELLDATGVALTPGVDFDPERGRHTLRISYATDTASVAEAMTRLKEHVAARLG